MESHGYASMREIAARFNLETVPSEWRELSLWTADGAASADMSALDHALEIEPIIREAERLGLSGEAIDRIRDATERVARSAVLREAARLMWRLLFEVPYDVALSNSAVPIPPVVESENERLFYAVLFLARVPALRAYHASLGIGAQHTNELLQDIPLWMDAYRRRHNEWGLTEVLWLRRLFYGQVHRLGRLQYEFRHFEWPFRVYRSRVSNAAAGRSQTVVVVDGNREFRTDGLFADGDRTSTFPPRSSAATSGRTIFEENERQVTAHPVSVDGYIARTPVTLWLDEWEPVLQSGDKTLAVHIPAGGKLVDADVEQSFADARAFFAAHFREFYFRAFTCNSWMMDPQLAEYLPEDANLIRFQRRFRLLPIPGADDHQHFERAFAEPVTEIESAPQENSLQRALVAHVRAHKGWRMTGGVILA